MTAIKLEGRMIGVDRALHLANAHRDVGGSIPTTSIEFFRRAALEKAETLPNGPQREELIVTAGTATRIVVEAFRHSKPLTLE